MSSETARLFEPLRLGTVDLSSRIVMGPLASNGADENNVLSSAAKKYYAERAQYPGTLIIAEATFVSPQASGIAESRAGIWSPAQIAAWKDVVSSVHEAGSRIFLQLWALGRSADPEIKQRQGTGDVVSSSAIPMEGGPVPRALTEDEIRQYIKDYTQSAVNAVEVAGFDGIELHGGNASLIDQFTQEVVNQRTDEWGGSVENRSRFALEITRSICDATGPDRVGFRLSPWSTYQSMGMSSEKTVAQFSHLLRGLKDLKIAHLHIVESRIAGRVDVAAGEPLTPFIDLWGDASPIVLAGGFSPEDARKAVDQQYKEKDVLISFGRAFVTNPDLVSKIKNGVSLVQ
ncbi:putative NADH:flavin oxidoreductase/NADH oxidase, aldolase-type TIM barrel, oxidoreductase Oye [Septoria linicola]|nr:putative NADH:flavin oxidoreductase/NADH oxidase, aldolase-type TIM barrel, oxidoreductase Oye [Septoria linicola]